VVRRSLPAHYRIATRRQLAALLRTFDPNRKVHCRVW
jgi:hypothetical protein